VILSDRAIRNYLVTGQIGIEPFDEKKLGAVSYDLTIGKIYRFLFGDIPIRILTECWLEPGVIYGLETLETISVKDITGIVSLRSRAARNGLFSSHSILVDPGYKGKLTFTVEPKRIRMFCRVGMTSTHQIIFMENTLVDKPWEGDSKRF